MQYTNERRNTLFSQLTSLVYCYQDEHECNRIVKPGSLLVQVKNNVELPAEVLKLEHICGHSGNWLKESSLRSSCTNCLLKKAYHSTIWTAIFCVIGWNSLYTLLDHIYLKIPFAYVGRPRSWHQIHEWFTYIFDYSTLIHTNIQLYLSENRRGEREGYLYMKWCGSTTYNIYG